MLTATAPCAWIIHCRGQVAALLGEKQVLRDQVQRLQREKAHLLEENSLLRGECDQLLLDGGGSGEEGGGSGGSGPSVAAVLREKQADLAREVGMRVWAVGWGREGAGAGGVCVSGDGACEGGWVKLGYGQTGLGERWPGPGTRTTL